MEDRKKKHIELALKSQVQLNELDERFYYEPLLSAHPSEFAEEFEFLDKSFNYPLWISSMTGGTPYARKINENLARICNEFGLGMGLGSCRAILDDDTHFHDFDLRDIIGEERAFYANLGISQVEQLIASNKEDSISQMISKLRADGLIIHVNPLQEWFQPEGDRIDVAPVHTVERLLERAKYPIIVKEVGQGMGPGSLKKLFQLPLIAVEFAAFGGTNFSRLELYRQTDKAKMKAYTPLANVGLDANAMLEIANQIVDSNEEIRCKQIILSGGIKNFLDGYYLLERAKLPAVYGQASAFLSYAREGYNQLLEYVKSQIDGLRLAKAYLRIKE